jgi:hypothetical protein
MLSPFDPLSTTRSYCHAPAVGRPATATLCVTTNDHAMVNDHVMATSMVTHHSWLRCRGRDLLTSPFWTMHGSGAALCAPAQLAVTLSTGVLSKEWEPLHELLLARWADVRGLLDALLQKGATIPAGRAGHKQGKDVHQPGV